MHDEVVNKYTVRLSWLVHAFLDIPIRDGRPLRVEFVIIIMLNLYSPGRALRKEGKD